MRLALSNRIDDQPGDPRRDGRLDPVIEELKRVGDVCVAGSVDDAKYLGQRV
jgi:hypothetical protein